MRTILVDDESWGLKRFQMECEHIEDIQLLGSFTSPKEAVEFVAGNWVELAFLDMEMPEMNGLELAGKLRELIPEIIIIFVSAYDDHMSEAFRTKKADYYVMKPYNRADIDDAVARAKLLSGRLRKVLEVRTFGTFELFVNGKQVDFQDEKSKEMFALLVERQGAPVSSSDIYGALFGKMEDGKEGECRLKCRQLFHLLKNQLTQVKMGDSIAEENQKYFLHPEVLECDLYRFRSRAPSAISQYSGEFMSGYEWAESTKKELTQIQKEELRKQKIETSHGNEENNQEQLAKEFNGLSEKCDALRKRCEILHDSEELYRTALGLTNHTITIVDIPKHALCQIYNEGSWSGVQTTMEDAPESIIKTGIIHPEDVEGYRQFYRNIYAGSEREECSIRVLSENGHWFWFTMYTQTIFDEKHVPQYAICFSDDLTSSREAELMSQQFVKIITSDAQYSWEANLTKDIIIRENKNAGEMIEGEDYTSFSQMNEIFLSQIAQKDQERVCKKFDYLEMMQAYYDGERELREEYQYRLPNTEKYIWMENITYLILDGNGDIHAIITTKDIDSIKRREKSIRAQAENDSLCQINRRDTFDNNVQIKLDEKSNGALFMIDIDYFKDVNDTYGHLFGDQVLVEVSKTLLKSFRSDDYVARYGGDEFVVFMEGDFGFEVLHTSVLALLQRIRSLEFSNGYHVTVSVGITMVNSDFNLENLYKKADAALYLAKEKGRDTYYIE